MWVIRREHPLVQWVRNDGTGREVMFVGCKLGIEQGEDPSWFGLCHGLEGRDEFVRHTAKVFARREARDLTVLREEFGRAGDAKGSSFGDEVVAATVVVQGRADIPCVRATAAPGSALGRRLINDSLAAGGRKGEAIPVVRSV